LPQELVAHREQELQIRRTRLDRALQEILGVREAMKLREYDAQLDEELHVFGVFVRRPVQQLHQLIAGRDAARTIDRRHRPHRLPESLGGSGLGRIDVSESLYKDVLGQGRRELEARSTGEPGGEDHRHSRQFHQLAQLLDIHVRMRESENESGHDHGILFAACSGRTAGVGSSRKARKRYPGVNVAP
jgi:hypothetical protein